MKGIFFIFIFIVIACPAFAKDKAVKTPAQILPADWEKWSTCATTADCTAVLGVCGTMEAINVVFVKDHQDYVNSAIPYVRCSTPDKSFLKDKPATVCVQNACAILAP